MEKIKLIDIGSLNGLSKLWNPIKHLIEEINFEAQENIALSNKIGESDFYLTENLACSSLLEPNFEILNKFQIVKDFKIKETIKIKTDLLDNQITEGDFIKLDTQGSELFILQGGKKLLKRVLGILIEVEFQSFYKNQPLFGEIDEFLRKNGFVLMEMKRHYLNDELVWADCLYLTSNKDLIKEKIEKARILGKLFKKLEWIGIDKKRLNFNWLRGRHKFGKYLVRLYQILNYDVKNKYSTDIEDL